MTSPDAAAHSGKYFHDRKVGGTSKRANDDELAKRLWELSETIAA